MGENIMDFAIFRLIIRVSYHRTNQAEKSEDC